MPRCLLSCYATECGEPCVDRYEASLEDKAEEMYDQGEW